LDLDPLRKLYGRELKAGTVIFREGDPGNKFYLIQSGKVRIVKSLGTRDEVHLTTFVDGDFFGEMALFELEPRAAAAVCETDVVVYELGQRNFENFILQKPRVAYQIMQKLCQRIRKLNDLAVERQQKSPASSSTIDPRLLALLVACCGRPEAGFVVVRPTVDIGELSRLYGVDMTQLVPLLEEMSSLHVAADLLQKLSCIDGETAPSIRNLLDRTLVGAQVSDSRKDGVGS